MNAEVKKLVREPLVWVGAALLCVPLLVGNKLTGLRDALTYESDSTAIATSFDPTAAPEVGINISGPGSNSRKVLSPGKANDLGMGSGSTMSLPPLPSSKNELTRSLPGLDSTDKSSISLTHPMPEIAMADPGSLLEMDDMLPGGSGGGGSRSARDAEPKADLPNAADADPEFDFLFGDESATEEKPKQADSTPSQRTTKDKSVAQQPSPSDTQPSPSEMQPSPSDLGSNLQDPDEMESPNWLFSESDARGQDVPETFELPPTELPSAALPLTELPLAELPSTELPLTDPGTIWEHGANVSPEIYGDPMNSLQAIQPEPAPMMPLHMEPQQFESAFGEHYVELDSGPDWWTPFCQQSIWETVPAQRTGLDAIVFAAMQHSPYVKLLSTEPQIAETIILEADSVFDWSAFVESSWNDTNRAVVSLLDTGTAGGRFVQQQLLFEAGVKKNLRTGGNLRVGQAWQRTDNNSLLLSPADQASAQILLDYRQPLLRGAGRHVNSSQVILAQLNFESSQNNSQALLQQFIVDVVSEYWELHFARGVLVQKLRSVERAEQLMAELASFPASTSRNRDVARIEAVAIARRTELIRASNEVATRQEKLLNLTYGTAMPDSAALEVVPVEAPGMFVVPHDLAFVTETAVQNRAEVQVALGAIRASAVRQSIALDELKPRLDAIVSTFLSGVDTNKDVGGAFADSIDFNPSYSVGLSFEVPLGRRNANAKISRQQLEYQRLQYQLEQTLGNVRLDARLALRNVSSIAKELENQKLAVAQAARELQYATGQAAAGVSKSADNTSYLLDDLMRSQEGLAAAESRLLRSQTDLSIALVQLKRATGQLLQTAPLPQISDYSVQQASFEQPSFEHSSYEQPSFEHSSYAESVPATTLVPVSNASYPSWSASQESTTQEDAESVWAPPELQ